MKWMQIRFVVPEDDGQKIMGFAERELGFKQLDEDWCTEKCDENNATMDYSPSPEPPNRKSDW